MVILYQDIKRILELKLFRSIFFLMWRMYLNFNFKKRDQSSLHKIRLYTWSKVFKVIRLSLVINNSTIERIMINHWLQWQQISNKKINPVKISNPLLFSWGQKRNHSLISMKDGLKESNYSKNYLTVLIHKLSIYFITQL